LAILAIAFIFAFLFYLALTAGSGNLLFWSIEELVFGLVFAYLAAILSVRLFKAAGVKPSAKMLSPKRWLLFFVYLIGPFFLELTKANIDVAKRVVTKKIKPGIVKISPGLKTDFGTTLLANSITLTPGTLTVDINKKKELFVHWIWVESKHPKIEQVCSSFPKWIRRITE